jgi:hypothetical protein
MAGILLENTAPRRALFNKLDSTIVPVINLVLFQIETSNEYEGFPVLQKLLDDAFLIERYMKTPEFNGNRLPLWI